MLEINKWFFVHLINFLVLLALLNYILFKPLLCLLTRRSDHVKSSLDSAKAMDKEKETQLQAVETKLTEARNKAKIIFEELSNEGLAKQKEQVETTQKDAAEINRKAKEALEKEIKKAKESLRKEVEIFSKMIVEKMVGV
jgi:F-type H+-transporting ATPase subunit b